ncbi:MAG TPA: ATP-dependent 6-phosphofructokinase [Acidobacteriota bacterium]|nr:ATP-dependent 6-phosphofructokinase [Acidobacteriota bacterium]
MNKHVGVLTAGGDCPGLNAVLRGIGKAALEYFGMQVIGFRDGFRGLMEDRTVRLDENLLSGILTLGGTILGTSRDKPHRMPVGDKLLDMTDVIVNNYKRHHLDVLVCLGGGGTQKSAFRLKEKGLNIITLPKTIDNDVAMTDVTFGFDTALTIATEAVDRLHSTAHSHHRIVVVEIMGHKAGWLALGAGIAGGADVILIPEIPYDVEKVAEAILVRSRSGKHFSIVAVAEGAMPKGAEVEDAESKKDKGNRKKGDRKRTREEWPENRPEQDGKTMRLAKQLEELTSLESRVTILGYLQRGGTPSAGDRLLATRLGTACAAQINEGAYGVMLAARGDRTEPVALEEVVGKRKTVPLDHPWIVSARRVGTSLGD